MDKAKIHYLTPVGKEKMEADMAQLRVERPAVLALLNHARAQGDLKENGAYQAAREKLTNMDRQIVKMELILRNSKVVEKNTNGVVSLGNTVSIKAGSFKQTFQIVGENEVDIKNKKISEKSPLGKCLIGKKKGDTAQLVTPVGKTVYTIMEVS